MRSICLATALCLGLALVGCGDTTTSRTLSGGAIGAGAGAGIGAAAGDTGLGAGIGAGAGLVGGYLYDQHKKGNID